MTRTYSHTHAHFLMAQSTSQPTVLTYQQHPFFSDLFYAVGSFESHAIDLRECVMRFSLDLLLESLMPNPSLLCTTLIYRCRSYYLHPALCWYKFSGICTIEEISEGTFLHAGLMVWYSFICTSRMRRYSYNKSIFDHASCDEQKDSGYLCTCPRSLGTHGLVAFTAPFTSLHLLLDYCLHFLGLVWNGYCWIGVVFL